MFRATHAPCLGAGGRDGTGNQPGLPRETLRTRSPTLPSAEPAATRGSPCVCVCVCVAPRCLCMSMCVFVCACVCVRARACVGGIAGQEPESCALAFRSTPFLLGLSCGRGCPLGVERGSRPLLWPEGRSHARLLPASPGDWGDATAQAACGHAWRMAAPPRAGSSSTRVQVMRAESRAALLCTQEFI